MASIKVTPNQFADMAVAFLLDAMMKDDVLPNNPEFQYILDKMEKGGMKAHLMSYYLDTSVLTRGKYKVLRKSFVGDEVKNTINIASSDDTKMPKDKKTTIRNIVKQTLKLIKNHRVKRNSGLPLNEETVDRIITKVLEDYNGDV